MRLYERKPFQGHIGHFPWKLSHRMKSERSGNFQNNDVQLGNSDGKCACAPWESHEIRYPPTVESNGRNSNYENPPKMDRIQLLFEDSNRRARCRRRIRLVRIRRWKIYGPAGGVASCVVGYSDWFGQRCTQVARRGGASCLASQWVKYRWA